MKNYLHVEVINDGVISEKSVNIEGVTLEELETLVSDYKKSKEAEDADKKLKDYIAKAVKDERFDKYDRELFSSDNSVHVIKAAAELVDAEPMDFAEKFFVEGNLGAILAVELVITALS